MLPSGPGRNCGDVFTVETPEMKGGLKTSLLRFVNEVPECLSAVTRSNKWQAA